MGNYKLVYELVSSGQRKGGAPQRLGGTYAPDAQGYAIAIQTADDEFLFLGSNIRVQFLPTATVLLDWQKLQRASLLTANG